MYTRNSGSKGDPNKPPKKPIEEAPEDKKGAKKGAKKVVKGPVGADDSKKSKKGAPQKVLHEEDQDDEMHEELDDSKEPVKDPADSAQKVQSSSSEEEVCQVANNDGDAVMIDTTTKPDELIPMQKPTMQQFIEWRQKEQAEKEKKEKDKNDEQQRLLREKLQKQLAEYRTRRGEMRSPDELQFNAPTLRTYQNLCKGSQIAVKALYTYQDCTRSVGVILSFVEHKKTDDKDEKVLTFVPLTLSVFVYIAHMPKRFLYSILKYATLQLMNELNLPPLSEQFEMVQRDADLIIDYDKIKLEIMFLIDWVSFSANQLALVAFRKTANLPKMKIDDVGLMKAKKSAGKSQNKITKQLENASAKKEDQGLKFQDVVMEDVTQEAEDQMDYSYSSIATNKTEYYHNLFSVQHYNQAVFNTIEQETIIRTNTLMFWNKFGLMKNSGELLKYNIHSKRKGRVMFGLPSTRFCLAPGQVIVKQLQLKKQEPELAHDILIQNINMNYLGFNAFAIIDQHYTLEELDYQQKLTKAAIENAKNRYFRKETESKLLKRRIIDFNRIEYAIDLVAFTRGGPKETKNMTEEQKQELKEREKERKANPKYEHKWGRTPAVTDQIQAMAMMYNYLYDHQFFYSKLFMFQVMCIMSETSPDRLESEMKRNPELCDLSRFQAFDNKWNFFNFEKLIEVDIQSLDPAKKKEFDEARALKKAQKKFKMQQTKGQNQLARDQEALSKGLKTKQMLKEEKKKNDEEQRAKQQAEKVVNPDRQQLMNHEKLKREKEQSNLKKRLKEEEDILTEFKKVVSTDNVQPDWHVFRFIEEQYDQGQFGPFIVQMTRKDKKSWVTEYAVIKHFKGEDKACVVFNSGGPTFYRFKQFFEGDKKKFALSGLQYYYTNKSIPKTNAELADENQMKYQKSKIEDLYRKCSIFKLNAIPNDKRDSQIKYRILYELIAMLGKYSVGGKEVLQNALQMLKNPIDFYSYHHQSKSHMFIQNQEVVDQMVIGELAKLEYPEVALQAQKLYPIVTANIGQSDKQTEAESKVLMQETKITSMLQECSLSTHKGGINLSKGGFNGLLQLKFISEMMYQNSQRAIEQHQTRPKGSVPLTLDQSIKYGLKQKADKNYAIEREVSFFLHAVATALISYMVHTKYTKEKMYDTQKLCLQQVQSDNGFRINTEETMQQIVGLYTSKSDKVKNANLLLQHESKTEDTLKQYYQNIANIAAGPQVSLVVHERMKGYIASVFMTERYPENQKKTKVKNKKKKKGKDEEEKKGDQPLDHAIAPVEQIECSYRFCIAQVLTKCGLRMMFEDVMKRFNIKHLGTIRRDINEKIQELAKKELMQLQNTPEQELENGVMCYTYDQDGNLITDVDENDNVFPFVKSYNQLTKVSNWRFAGRAAINVALFNNATPPLKLDTATLETCNYYRSHIWQNPNAIHSVAVSTKASSVTKAVGLGNVGGGQILIPDKDAKEDINKLFIGQDIPDADTNDEDLTLCDEAKHLQKQGGDDEQMDTFENFNYSATPSPSMFRSQQFVYFPSHLRQPESTTLSWVDPNSSNLKAGIDKGGQQRIHRSRSRDSGDEEQVLKRAPDGKGKFEPLNPKGHHRDDDTFRTKNLIKQESKTKDQGKRKY